MMTGAAINTKNDRSIMRLWRNAIIVMMLALLTACSTSDNSDLHEKLASIKARPAGKIPPLPVFVPYQTFMYAAQTKQDPFKGFGADMDEGTVQDVIADTPLAGRNLETLEQYPLDTLRYVGQLTKDGSEWAIITSPDMIVHRVKVSNHLGTNYGEIVQILENKILIEEIIPDEIGGWIKREAALSLME